MHVAGIIWSFKYLSVWCLSFIYSSLWLLVVKINKKIPIHIPDCFYCIIYLLVVGIVTIWFKSWNSSKIIERKWEEKKRYKKKTKRISSRLPIIRWPCEICQYLKFDSKTVYAAIRLLRVYTIAKYIYRVSGVFFIFRKFQCYTYKTTISYAHRYPPKCFLTKILDKKVLSIT